MTKSKFPLPRLRLPLKVPNPDIDWTEELPVDEYYMDKMVDVEVLTVNFNAGTMRVRTVDRQPAFDSNHGEWTIVDIEANPFFEHYQVVPKV